MSALRHFTTRLPAAEIQRLEEVAKKQKISKTELARDLISRGLDRLVIAENKAR